MNYDLNTTDGMKNAINWTAQHLAALSDGGTWFIPRSGTVVVLNKKEHSVTIKEGYRPDPSIARVLTAMGYTVNPS